MNKNIFQYQNIYFCNDLIDIIINTNLIGYFKLKINYFININKYFLSACKFNNVNIVRYLIKNYKIDIYHKDKYGNNCLFYALCNSVDMIKYLISNYKFNINIENNFGHDCLMFACSDLRNINITKNFKMIPYSNSIHSIYYDNHLMYKNSGNYKINNYSNNLDIIKYLIEYCKINIDHVDHIFNNCLIYACWYNSDINVVKYLIEENKMNVNFKNIYGSNCLLAACNNNQNIDIIKYLIENRKMDINIKNDLGNNCLLSACLSNSNINIIRYLIEDLNMNINYKNKINSNCLLLACQSNENIDIIKYLIEDCGMNINFTNNVGVNCLLKACHDNLNIDILKYLIEDCKMNVNYKNKGTNCLLMACDNNSNIDIIKYLVEDYKMDTNIKNIDNDSCLSLACNNNKNTDIIKYLIEHCQTNIYELLVDEISIDNFNFLRKTGYINFIKNAANKNSINNIITENNFSDDNIKIIFDYIINNNLKGNLISSEEFFKKISFNNLLILATKGIKINLSFSDLNSLKMMYSMNCYVSVFNSENICSISINDIKYFVNKKIIYQECNMIKKVIDSQISEYNDISLKIPDINDNIINIYINLCYGHKYVLQNLNYTQLVDLLLMLDMYPLNNFKLGELEYYVCNKYSKNNIYDIILKNICKKYELKYLLSILYNKN